MKRLIFLLSISLVIILSACNQNKKGNKKNKDVEQNQPTTSDTMSITPSHNIDYATFEADTIVVTGSAKGKRMRLSMLQQKALFLAKNKLADSIAVLNHQIDSINVDGTKTYREIVLRDVHIIKEWFGYPNPADKSIIEAYITIGMENKPN